MTKITYKGQEYDMDAAVNLMDNELREELHSKGFEDEQSFFDAYVVAHARKFEEEFAIN